MGAQQTVYPLLPSNSLTAIRSSCVRCPFAAFCCAPVDPRREWKIEGMCWGVQQTVHHAQLSNSLAAFWAGSSCCSAAFLWRTFSLCRILFLLPLSFPVEPRGEQWEGMRWGVQHVV